MATKTHNVHFDITASDKASAIFSGAQRSMGQLGSGLATVQNALAAVGVAIGAGAMLELHRQVMVADAGLKDMAKSAASSVEVLSSIRRVAQVGGHDFEGLQAQLAKTVRGLQENTEEGGKAARAFDFLGIKTRDGQGRFRDMGEVLIEVARKLEQYEDGGNKVALIQDALGKGAERYLPLLEDIAEGTDLVAKVTAKQAAELERVEKEMRRFNVAMEDGRRLLVNEYSPAFRELLEQGTEGIRVFGGFWSAFYNVGVGINPFNSLAENIRELNREIAQAETESPYQRALRESFVVGRADVDTMTKRRDFLKFQQRQGANRLISGDNADARDLRVGLLKKPLDYRTGEGGGDAKALREAEFIAQKQVELEEMAEQDKREAQDIATKYRVAELARVNQVRLDNERAIIEAIDREQEQAIADGQIILESREVQLDTHFRNQVNMLINARERGILTETEYNDRLVELAIQHEAELTGITNTAYQQRQRFVQSSMMQQAQTIFGEMANITAGVSQHSKSLFKINQVAGIANAVINAYTGISKTLAAYPYPWNLGMAALHAAVAFAQVRAISSAQYGGGGAAPSLAGGTAATPVTPVSSGTPERRGPDTFIQIRGDDIFSGRTLAKFAERFSEFNRDGGRTVVVVT